MNAPCGVPCASLKTKTLSQLFCFSDLSPNTLSLFIIFSQGISLSLKSFYRLLVASLSSLLFSVRPLVRPSALFPFFSLCAFSPFSLEKLSLWALFLYFFFRLSLSRLSFSIRVLAPGTVCLLKPACQENVWESLRHVSVRLSVKCPRLSV